MNGLCNNKTLSDIIIFKSCYRNDGPHSVKLPSGNPTDWFMVRMGDTAVIICTSFVYNSLPACQESLLEK